MYKPDGNLLRELVVILYARVSSRAQDEKGLSIPGQLRELHEWAARKGYRVLAEVVDKGGKDSKRDVFGRPGINQIFDLVESRDVDMVIAQSTDRIGERWIPELLADELRKHDTKLCVLNSGEARQLGRGGGDELLDLVKGWQAGEERREMARRSRSKKLEKARQGYVVLSHTPPYGFERAGGDKHTTLAVNEERMAVVRRIFHMVGVEGLGIRTVARRLNEEGIPTPPNKAKLPEYGHLWNREFLRKCVLNPVYKSSTLEELARYVARGEMSSEVFDQLREEEVYGVWKYRGRDYGGDEHAVTVPVVDAGIPREVVDSARDVVKKNVADKASSAGGRGFWELSFGILFCGGCGGRMSTHSPGPRRGEKVYRYYRCPRVDDATKEPCPVAARLSAERTEEAVWRFVVDLRTRPKQLLASLDRAIEEHKESADTRDSRALYARVSLLAKRRHVYQDQQAVGLMTLEELRAKLGELEEAQEAIRRELDTTEDHDEILRQLEQAREQLATEGLPDGVDTLKEWEDKPPRIETGEDGALRMRSGERRTPEERREVYQDMRLEAVAHSKTEIVVRGLLFEPERVYIPVTSRRPCGR